MQSPIVCASQMWLPGLRHSKGGTNERSAIRGTMIVIQLEAASLGLGPALSLLLDEDNPGCLFVEDLSTLIADNESIKALWYLK